MTEERNTRSIVRDNTATHGGTITVITAGGDIGAQDPWVSKLRAELDKARSLLADLQDQAATTTTTTTTLATIADAAQAVEEMDSALADPKKHRMSIKGLIPVLFRYAETISGLGAIVGSIEEISHHL